MPLHLESKAKLCGYLAGDGSLIIGQNGSQKTERYDIRFYPDDYKMAQCFQEAFFEIYGRKVPIRKSYLSDAYYFMRITDKIAALDLSRIGKFGGLDWDVPFTFFKSDQMKIEWLRAFFDCEAYVGVDEIRVQSVNKKGLQGVKEALTQLGIASSKIYEYHRKQPTWNTNYYFLFAPKPILKSI